IIATADNYSQSSYFLAAQADEVYVHEMGGVTLEGYGRYQMYYGDALGRLEIDFNIFRVGKYKSAVEPFLRNDMSEAARAANLEWMGDLWTSFLTDIGTARELNVETLRDYSLNYDRKIAETDGDSAKAALNAGLVDHAVARDKVRARLIELVGEDTEEHTFNQIAGEEYLAYMRSEKGPENPSSDAVAVIVARGAIADGEQPAGSIGGDSTAALIRQARTDDKVKALVLRVDSGGGSAFASEIIRREFELARAAGKPVVVSMGSVAASGGYWIATASDEIWASPTTITGSIGIFGMFPTFQRPLAKHLGIHVDGVATGPLAGVRSDRALDPRVGQMIQRQIEHGYDEFLARVSEARDMTREEVDLIAQGRVWSGQDAHAHGLVDELGGLSQAIASAAAKADLGENYRVQYVAKELDFKDQLLHSLAGNAEVQQAVRAFAGQGIVFAPLVRFLEEQIMVVSAFNDPNGVYAYAFIDVD
ncbi:MAG: signal peptide peptidase SppA, partial [Nannocystaceae bacterium]|nr:signal peptide peptidase SppA [Nannocystaceae bacterium]